LTENRIHALLFDNNAILVEKLFVHL